MIRIKIAHFCLACLVSLWLVTPSVGQDQVNLKPAAGKPLSDVQAFWIHGKKRRKLRLEDGVFKGVPPMGLVVVRTDEMEFFGLVRNGENQTLKLERPEPPTRTLKTRDHLDREVRTKLKEAIEQSLLESIERVDESTATRGVAILAKLSPKTALEFVNEHRTNRKHEIMIKESICKTLIRRSPELAAEIAESIDEPQLRVRILMKMWRSLPPKNSIRGELETQLFSCIDQISVPGIRLAILGVVANEMQREGREETADSIVKQNLNDVKKLPSGGWSAYPRTLYAALLVDREPDESRRLLEGIDSPSERHRALGRVAFHAASSNPKLAIEFLEKLEPETNLIAKFAYHVQVAAIVGKRDPKTAQKVIQMITEPNQRCWAKGLLALEISRTPTGDRQLATTLINEVIRELNQENSEEKMATEHFAKANTLAGLLPVAEVVAPMTLEPIIWQAVWLNIPKTRWTQYPGQATTRRQMLAAAIARYDHQIADAILDDPVTFGDANSSVESAIDACLAVRPNYLLQLLQNPEKPIWSQKDTARTSEKMISLLNRSSTSFWNEMSAPRFLEWRRSSFD